MFSLFSGKRSKSVPRILHPSGREPLKREGKLTRRDEAKIYAHGPSFIDFLPWVEYLPEDECLLLDDGVSVGAVFSLSPGRRTAAQQNVSKKSVTSPRPRCRTGRKSAAATSGWCSSTARMKRT